MGHSEAVPQDGQSDDQTDLRTEGTVECKLRLLRVNLCVVQATPGGNISNELWTAWKWWLKVLKQSISETKEWKQADEQKLCHLFVDAASTPSRVAAVLCIDGNMLYTDTAPDEMLMNQLIKRGDKQITSLV